MNLHLDAVEHRGFGTELITRRAPYELQGHGLIELRTEGVHCAVELPLLLPGESILDTSSQV